MPAVIASEPRIKSGESNPGQALDDCSTCPWIASPLVFEVGYSRLSMTLLVNDGPSPEPADLSEGGGAFPLSKGTNRFAQKHIEALKSPLYSAMHVI
ncbi:MAG: hypothetical protein QOC72_2778 [Methylobacteriaceae bacterium]|jgi:hypothetical protein|nr:hypothetical protein [Methylobacteriaceae bacterium]